jgi:hypothetical protein
VVLPVSIASHLILVFIFVAFFLWRRTKSKIPTVTRSVSGLRGPEEQRSSMNEPRERNVEELSTVPGRSGPWGSDDGTRLGHPGSGVGLVRNGLPGTNVRPESEPGRL